jgi:hypothetical protein
MGSLGLVGEVFEVKTQVDRDLTTVSIVDRQLRLIKNMGRHSLDGVQLFIELLIKTLTQTIHFFASVST